ncbi:LA_2444/LA_4059 family outer membrane protein [Leptospira bandrabouensis]|uniref:LA_2444/LA_4059 family outer membrane protein n=1 Tax=Leptospira bandrabouensis TaxID=2484903 RepID=UPI001EE8F106|nr:LA_2444/LA_4059 family outer membrane protein [Leptospira bandrabouensis]MCG6144317.1 LA_2444/LA_4059 family outer membrane protein [Leptospira bandrabouensis]MCG6159978.1 LA_2444/LA_4059 family outer membrane protein [Leptospira bandrabouensis]MCG6163911.1 LA_2444/LA_4059 family outer membrane protein [Leptospira bandrabouensis]
MKQNLIYLFLVSVSSMIFAEGREMETSILEGKNKKSEWSLLLKRQTYHYLPYEYSSLTDKNESIVPTRSSSALKENGKVLIPFVFSYENLEKGFKVDLSYFEIEIVNANTLLYQQSAQGGNVSRFYLSPTARSEFELNLYQTFLLNKDWKLYLGGGVRNINRYLYGNYLGQGTFKEYFFTYGPQVSAQTIYQLSQKLALHLTMDVFYTQGTRFFKQPNLMEDRFQYSLSTAGTEGIFRGYEWDGSLSYSFHPNMKFFVGYNMIVSKFSYLHYNEIQFSSNTANLGSQNPSVTDTWEWNLPKKSENFDRLRGIYLGMMVSF